MNKPTIRKGHPEYGPTHMITFRPRFDVSGADIATALVQFHASGYKVNMNHTVLRTHLTEFLIQVAHDHGMSAFLTDCSFGDESRDYPDDWNDCVRWAVKTVRVFYPEMDDKELAAFEGGWVVKDDENDLGS